MLQVCPGLVAVQSDFAWLVPSWGQTVALLLFDAEELLDKTNQPNYVCPADLTALEEGAENSHQKQ